MTAACAPDPWPEEGAARVIACEQAPVRVDEPQLRQRLRWSQAIRQWERAQSHFAVLPWELSEGDQSCQRDEQCAVRARCLAQRCWRSPRTPSELRRWFRGEEALSGAQLKWELLQIGPREIELRSTGATPGDQIFALYLGARWVSARGHALGASLRPIHWIAPRQMGAADRKSPPPREGTRRYSSLILCDTLASSTQP